MIVGMRTGILRLFLIGALPLHGTTVSFSDYVNLGWEMWEEPIFDNTGTCISEMGRSFDFASFEGDHAVFGAFGTLGAVSEFSRVSFVPETDVTAPRYLLQSDPFEPTTEDGICLNFSSLLSGDLHLEQMDFYWVGSLPLIQVGKQNLSLGSGLGYLGQNHFRIEFGDDFNIYEAPLVFRDQNLQSEYGFESEIHLSGTASLAFEIPEPSTSTVALLGLFVAIARRRSTGS